VKRWFEVGDGTQKINNGGGGKKKKCSNSFVTERLLTAPAACPMRIE